MRATNEHPGSDTHVGGGVDRGRRAAPLRAPRLLALLLLTALLPAAFAQSGAAGTSIVLPAGNVCEPLPEGERFAVRGQAAEYACGEDGALVLVGGLLERGGRVSVEAAAVEPTPAQAFAHELVTFDIRRLVLANGMECLPLDASATSADGRRVGYECREGADGAAGGPEGGRWVLVGSLTVDGTTVNATLAGDPSTLDLQDEERVAVDVLDGSFPFTEREWTLASFGTGEDPPLAGAAPTLVFGPGRVGGNASCNSYFASVISRGAGELRIGQPGSTLMACEEDLMDQEFRFLRALEGVTGYELVDDTLYLFGGAEVMTFEAQPGR